MNAAIGRGAVFLGFLGAVFGAATLIVGLAADRPVLRRTGRRYVLLVLAGAVLAAVAMERALLGHDFSLRYVAENHSRSTPLLYTIASLWAALEGSIILWSLVLAGYLATVAHRFRDRLTDPMVGWALVTGFVVAAFFFGLMLGPANPFREVAGAVPADGPGPNPLLQNHPLMAIHPPMLYLPRRARRPGVRAEDSRRQPERRAEDRDAGRCAIRASMRAPAPGAARRQ